MTPNVRRSMGKLQAPKVTPKLCAHMGLTTDHAGSRLTLAFQKSKHMKNETKK